MRPHHDIPLLLGFYLDGRFPLGDMVSKTYKLSEFDLALHDLEAGILNRGVFALA